jgi:hypothetical protein
MVIATSLNRQVSTWSRWRSLGHGERRLLLEALVVLPAMTGAVTTLRLGTILAWLGLQPLLGEEREGTGSRFPDPSMAQRHLARQVGEAITRVGARTPWTSTCLARALAAAWLLRRRGVPLRLTLGVASPVGLQEGERTPEAAAIDAHAWLEAAGERVTGESPGRVFQPLARFGSPEAPA